MTEELEKKRALSRRTVVKGAAWSVPVIATAVAAPMASASVTSARVEWQNPNTDLLNLTLLDGTAVAAAGVLPTGPTSFTIYNDTPGDIEGPITGTISIVRAGGLPILAAKGYAVKAVDGSGAAVTNRIESLNGSILGGTYDTTQDITLAGGVSGASRTVAVDFALTNGGALGIAVLVNFIATLELFDKNGTAIGSATTSNLTLPVGLNVL